MSVMRRPANKFVIPCAALAVLLSPLGEAATAFWPGYEVTTSIVNFADLDLGNSQGVATLYARIKSAADKVCGPGESMPYEVILHARRCTKLAIAQAVKDVNAAGLTSLHRAATNQMDFP
jgi:UrcA family protein